MADWYILFCKDCGECSLPMESDDEESDFLIEHGDHEVEYIPEDQDGNYISETGYYC